MTRKFLQVDRPLLVATLLLLGLGLVMVFSASANMSEERFGSAYLFVRKQLLWDGLGIAVLFLCMRMDYHRARFRDTLALRRNGPFASFSIRRAVDAYPRNPGGQRRPSLLRASSCRLPLPAPDVLYRSLGGRLGRRVPTHPVASGVRLRWSSRERSRSLAA